MRHYCTLFDSKYLPQGLALYASLKRHSSEPFKLYILPLDPDCDEILRRIQLPNLVVLDLRAFEHDQKLTEIRKARTWQEYAWTCASNLCEWLLFCTDCDFPELSYIDADCFFFSDPKVIFDEIGTRSIGIIPHRFIRSKKHLEVNGKFNVSLVHFKNDPVGRECLAIWARQCRDRCSAKEGCGDQVYLDAWPQKYGAELCVIQNIGVGVAPWNLLNYLIWISSPDGCRLIGDAPLEGGEITWSPLVFYHFHEFRRKANGTYHLTNYELRNVHNGDDVGFVYAPYIAAVEEQRHLIEGLRIAVN